MRGDEGCSAIVERNGIEVTEDFDRSNTPGPPPPSRVWAGRDTPTPTPAIPRVVEIDDCRES